MLEPSDVPRVTMGDRLAAAEREIERLKAERGKEIDSRMRELEKRLEAEQRNTLTYQTLYMNLQAYVEERNKEIGVLNVEIKRLKAELARNSVSLDVVDDPGAVSLAPVTGGELSEAPPDKKGWLSWLPPH